MEYVNKQQVLDKLAVIYDLARTDQKAPISCAISDINDLKTIDTKEILKYLDSLMICVGNAYNTSHGLLQSDMAFIEKQEKFIRELLSNKI